MDWGGVGVRILGVMPVYFEPPPGLPASLGPTAPTPWFWRWQNGEWAEPLGCSLWVSCLFDCCDVADLVECGFQSY